MTPERLNEVKALWKSKRRDAIGFLIENEHCTLFRAFLEPKIPATRYPPDDLSSVTFNIIDFEIRQQRYSPEYLARLPLFRTFDIYFEGVLIDRLSGI